MTRRNRGGRRSAGDEELRRSRGGRRGGDGLSKAKHTASSNWVQHRSEMLTERGIEGRKGSPVLGTKRDDFGRELHFSNPSRSSGSNLK